MPEIKQDIRATTFVVASNDSLHRNDADYVCDGVADEVEINAALAACPATGGRVVLLAGTFVVAAAIVLQDNCVLEGQDYPATNITNGGAINIIEAGAVNAGLKNLVIDHSGGGIGGCIATNNAACVLYVDNCEITGVAAPVNSIVMTAGYVLLRTCALQAGDIDLSTAPCTLEIYLCQIAGGGIDLAGAAHTLNISYTRIVGGDITTAAEAIAHAISLYHVEMNGNDLVSAATGATTLLMRGCTTVDTVSHAGTGAFVIRDSDVATVTSTAAGVFTIFGGNINACGGATASVTWKIHGRQYEVIAGMLVQHAIDAAVADTPAPAVTDPYGILIHPSVYNEALVPADHVNLVGLGERAVRIVQTGAGNILTVGNVTCQLMNLALDHSGGGAGACVFVTNAGSDIYLEHCEITGRPAAVHVIRMIAGRIEMHDCEVLAGDIDLSTAACTFEARFCNIANGDIDLAGIFVDHNLMLDHVDMNGGNIDNAATGAVTIELTYVSDINTFTDAGLVGTVLIEHSFTLLTTKTGTSPWTVRVASMGTVSNNNATGAILIYGGFVFDCNGAVGAVVWYEDSGRFRVLENMEIQDALDVLPAGGGEISVGEGAFALAAQIARAIDDVTIRGSGLATRITLDGVTPVITAGAQDGWILEDFDVDAGLVEIQFATNSHQHVAVNGLWAGVINPDLGQTSFPGQPVIRIEEIRPLDPAATEIIRDFSRKEYQLYNPTFATPQFIMELLRRQARYMHVPINDLWTDNSTGGTSVLFPQYAELACAAVGGQDGLVHCTAAFLNSYVDARVWDRVDFDNMFIWAFDVSRGTGSHADIRARVQLKQANAEGVLADDGMGIEIQNLSIFGEAFAGAQGTVDLGVLMTTLYTYRIAIVLIPNVSVDFYVNEVYRGQITAQVPTGPAAGTCYWVLSIDNGAVATACQLRVSPISYWNHL